MDNKLQYWIELNRDKLFYKTSVLYWSFGKYFSIMALHFKIILFQITNKTNLTWPYLNNVTSPSLTLLGATKGHLQS